jgi:DNA repair exonuclease SbcCD ATPase subunit
MTTENTGAKAGGDGGALGSDFRAELEKLGHYDEAGRFRIKWENLLSFISKMLNALGLDVDIKSMEDLARISAELQAGKNKMANTIAELKKIIEQRDAEILRLKEIETRLAQLQAILDQRAGMSKDELEKLRAELAALKAENDRLKAEMEAKLREAEAKLADERRKYETAVPPLEETVVKHEHTITALNAEVTSLKELLGPKIDFAKKIRELEILLAACRERLLESEVAADYFTLTGKFEETRYTKAAEAAKGKSSAAGALAECEKDVKSALRIAEKLLQQMNDGKGTIDVMVNLVRADKDIEGRAFAAKKLAQS